jgi:3-hydroxy-9,10-secoandrosta-1,3,5(10)-triene-9,17-dione monooxygenase reductase component
MIDPGVYRRILGHYPTGVCVVTSDGADGPPVGMAVGSFTSVSLSPPLVAFFPDKGSTSWPKIERTGRFCINILADDQEWLCRRFASRIEDKFEGVTHRVSGQGLPILDGVIAWIDCTLHAVHEAGDHYIVLGKVEALNTERPSRPLLFFQGLYGQFSPLEASSAGAPS